MLARMLDRPRHDGRRLVIFISPSFFLSVSFIADTDLESASLLRPTLLRADDLAEPIALPHMVGCGPSQKGATLQV
jgi:hypothetical protein